MNNQITMTAAQMEAYAAALKSDVEAPFVSRVQTIAEMWAGWEPPVIGPFGEVRGSLITCTADTGTGKTQLFIKLFMGLSIQRDLMELGLIMDRPQRVVFFSAENPNDVRNRLLAECFRLGVDLKEFSATFRFVGGIDDTGAVVKELALLKEEGFVADFILIDTLSAYLATDTNVSDFNVNGPAVKALRKLRIDLENLGSPTVFLPAHAIKNLSEVSDLVPLGGGTIVFEVDGNLGLWKEDDSGLISMQVVRKFRGPAFSKKYFRIKEAAVPQMKDSTGKPLILPYIITEHDPVILSSQEVLNREQTMALRIMIGENPKPRAGYARHISSVLESCKVVKSDSTVRKWLDGFVEKGLVEKIEMPAEDGKKAYTLLTLSGEGADHLVATGNGEALK